MKVLISWMSKASDFHQGEVNEQGPNFSFHQFFYAHDQHILLCSEKKEDTAFEFLLNALQRKYPKRVISGRYLGIHDVIDLEEVLSKIQPLLLKYKDHPLDIFFSPGTSIMQLAWFIAHTSLGLQTTLIQLREAKLTPQKKPEKLILQVDPSPTPISATLKEIKSDEKREDFLITENTRVIFERAERVSNARNATVLITGETGTGKEIIASYIHQNSARRNYPFLAINCSAFSDNLLESRLFGYQKGAFTDAKKDTKGLFQEAEGGTLFLDEIGDISPYMQQSLLRVLQEKEVHPIGGKPFTVDVRIIAATNRDLISLCKAEKYRWDLYYRLAVAEIDLPPLRERGVAEIEDMLHFFLRKKQKEMHHPYQLKFEKEAWNKLLQYPFPGNIREMVNMIESLYVFCERVVTLHDLPARIHQPANISYSLADIERAHILKVTEQFGGRKKKTAEALGISYNTYKKKLNDFGYNDGE